MSWNGGTQSQRNSQGSNVLMGGGSGSGQTDGTGSWVNFDLYAVGLARDGAANAATAAGATWFTTDATARLRPVDTTVGGDDDGIDQTLLAQVFISPGGAVSFNGKINTSAAVGAPFSFTIGGAVVNPDPIDATVFGSASGTVLNPGQAVSVSNAQPARMVVTRRRSLACP